LRRPSKTTILTNAVRWMKFHFPHNSPKTNQMRTEGKKKGVPADAAGN